MPKKVGKIYYIIPDIQRRDYSLIKLARAIYQGNGLKHLRYNWFIRHKPVGGIKVILQHCMLLRAQGFDAIPLQMGEYFGNFFNYDLTSQSIDDVGFHLNPDDVVVVPEHAAHLGPMFHCGFRILFAQNGGLLYSRGGFSPDDTPYVDKGYDFVFYCSDSLKDDLSREPAERIYLINNFIDQTIFQPNPNQRKPGRIMALPRKNPDDLKKIMQLMKAVPNHHFHLVDGASEAEIIAEYQQADIFLPIGYPEGFGLPQLEAMACGAAVAGFTGGGADEFMRDRETALVARDGDAEGAVECLKALLGDSALKERLRDAGRAIAQTYTQERTAKQLADFFETQIWEKCSRRTALKSLAQNFFH
ncbi:MAG: glycosyltransferase family 4 protein [Spongiibacteraceae bacterium]